jgi:hemerythrin-like domain-containing protein
MPRPLAQMYAQHSSLAAVLHAMTVLVREVRDRGKRIDPKVFRAIIYYLDVFPEREHHRNEELVLFPLIRLRTHEADALLDQLAREHMAGEQAIRDLEQAFLRYEERPGEFASFAAAAERYVEHYLEHMRKEEREVMPIAQRVLSAEDWRRVEAEFGAKPDPLAGTVPETDPEELFRRIVMLVPAPYGVGAPFDD